MLVAILGDIGNTIFHGGLRRMYMDLLATNVDLAGIRLVDAEDHACNFGSSGTHQSCEAKYLALADLEGDILKCSSACQMSYVEGHFSRFDGMLGIERCQFATNHLTDNLFGG